MLCLIKRMIGTLTARFTIAKSAVKFEGAGGKTIPDRVRRIKKISEEKMDNKKRLTLHDLHGAYSHDRDNITAEKAAVIYDRLAELEDKIEDGTLVELPCKVGDTVYCVCYYYNRRDGEIKQKLVSSFAITDKIEIHTDSGLYGYDYWNYGVDAFLTKAEAEAKLKELRGEK